MNKLCKIVALAIVITILFGFGPLTQPVYADPALPLPRIPICGDQDGSETPYILNCPSFSVTPDISAYQVSNSIIGPVEIRFDFVFREASYNNELGLFQVDDANFAIGGLHPGDSGYLAAVFQRVKIIFPSGSNAFTPDVSFSFNPGDILAFFIIQDNTVANFMQSNPGNDLSKLPLAFFSIDELNPDGVDHFVGFQNVGAGLVQFGFEDLTSGGDRDYDDVVYDMSGNVNPVQVALLFTTSYYVQTKNQKTMKDLGYKLGRRDSILDGIQDDIVILAFGMPMLQVGQYGASLYAAGFAPTSDIEGLVEQFAIGYYTGVHVGDTQSHLRIVVGTSNCKFAPYDVCKSSEVTEDHGRAWGQMVNNIASRIINDHLSSQVDVAGGSDMELAWNTADATKKWVDGYASVSTRYLYNFGDAAGCPQSGTTELTDDGPFSICNRNNGWSQKDVWHISWESPPAWPLPENYNTLDHQAQQWQQISLYSYFKPNFPRMVLAGSLTQYQACHQPGRSCDPTTQNSPTEGWTSLFKTLNNADPRTAQFLRWSTDIMWGPK